MNNNIQISESTKILSSFTQDYKNSINSSSSTIGMKKTDISRSLQGLKSSSITTSSEIQSSKKSKETAIMKCKF